MSVDVTTTQNPVTVSVNDTNVSVSVTDNVTTATVSGGTGPQGPTGPQGDPASLTPATTTAIGGIIVGTGLSVTGNGTLSATGAVSSVAGRTGAVTLTTADVSGYTAPPVTSVAGRTGTVTLTTADVSGYVAPQVFSVAGRTGTVTLTTSDISGYTSPPVSSVAGKTGTVTLTTSDISGFNAAASAAAPVQSVAGRTGAVTLTTADVSGYTAPTVSSVAGRTGTVTLSTSDISGLGTLATQSGTFSGTSSGTNTGDQTITLTGDVTGSGTGSFAATLAASGATAGTYTSVTVDTKGRVTSGTNPAGYSLPNATTSSLGGVIVGSGLSVSSGTVSANVTSVAGRTGAVTISSGDVSGLAASATTNALNASNITSGTLPDAQLSSNIPTKSAVLQTLGYSTTSVDATSAQGVASNSSITSGTIYFAFFTPLITTTISKISFATGTASSSLTLARFGLYTFDETTATLVARTDSDTTLFAAANTIYQRSLSATGGYPTTYTLNAGTRYGVAFIVVGTTMGQYAAKSSVTGILSAALKQGAQAVSNSDLVTSTSSLSIAAGMPWARMTP